MSSAGTRCTVPSILDRKHSKSKISCLTAYDYSMARILDLAGIDVLLVGDSLASTVQGHKNTLPVTLEEMIYHCRCVVRGVDRALVVGDMPFMSYQISPEKARESAGRIMKEGGVGAVKLEGGIVMAETISSIVAIDIPVMGHVGLTPQSYHRMGGHKLQGNQSGDFVGSRDRILADAIAVQDAGAFAVVLEGIPIELAQEITQKLSIPTIGIGAGPFCDGQILVTHDLLGMDPEFSPRFVKKYADLAEAITGAVKQYSFEVSSGEFPTEKNAVHEKKSVKIYAA